MYICTYFKWLDVLTNLLCKKPVAVASFLSLSTGLRYLINVEMCMELTITANQTTKFSNLILT